MALRTKPLRDPMVAPRRRFAAALSLVALCVALQAAPSAAFAQATPESPASDPAPGPEPAPDPNPDPAPEPKPEPDPDPGPPPVPQPEAEAHAELESESALEAELDLESPADKAQISAWAGRQRVGVLERELRVAQHEERDAVSWIPWVMMGTGAAAVATGLLGGALPVAACDDSCPRTNWTAVVLVGGAALATAGSIWLLLAHRDEAELRLRRERLEQQLDDERWNQRQTSDAALHWSGRL